MRFQVLALVAFFLAGNTFATPLRAQDGKPTGGPRYPGGSQISFKWDYSCPTGKDCSFSCGSGGASHVTKLSIYLGTMPLGSTEHAAAVFYDFATMEVPRANGFSINTGISSISCQVNGMELDYSGPPN